MVSFSGLFFFETEKDLTKGGIMIQKVHKDLILKILKVNF